MNELYTVLYVILLVVIWGFILSQTLAVFASIVAAISTDFWTVDINDPESRKSRLGSLRPLEALEIVVVGRAGAPRFPVLTETARRLSVHGLQNGEPGMQHNKPNNWKLIRVPGSKVYYPLIQSQWGYLNPIYTFRKLTHWFTGRHVIKVWFPFYLAGFWRIYEPILMEFVRARERGLERRPHQRILDDMGGHGAYQIVEDQTDHLLEQFQLRSITETLPTMNGFSLRIDATLVLQVVNVHNVVVWKKWSKLLHSVVANAVGVVVRAGSIEDVYAAHKGTTQFQEIITKYLRNEGGVHPFERTSVLNLLGLKLLQVNLNDLIPADVATETAINRIMSIEIEGTKVANVGGLKLQKQIEALKGASNEQVNNLAAITAAQGVGQGKGKVDYILSANQPTQGLAPSDAFLRRIAEATSEGKQTKGGEK